MRAILPLLSLASAAQALYFFIDGTAPKCFFEELPKDTLVVGHYHAEEWDDHTNSWSKHDGISIYISVDVSADSLSTTSHATAHTICCSIHLSFAPVTHNTLLTPPLLCLAYRSYSTPITA